MGRAGLMPRHLLVTNDFPPKLGGIQAYLWELWRRLPADDVAVYTTPYAGSDAFDAQQDFRIERSPEPFLLPNPVLLKRINTLAAEVGAEFVVLDPAVPLGALGPNLDLPYAVVLHGAEVTIPGRLPLSSHVLRRTLRGSGLAIAAGGYPAAEAELAAQRPLNTVIIPPGVDTQRFQPLSPAERKATRDQFDLPNDAQVILGVSRLVPRKGFDTVIRAVARLAVDHPNVLGVIAGDGRDHERLERLAASLNAPVRFLGRVPDASLPALYGAADLFAMMSRVRWMGLEQEGFGIVFVEAAATGIPQVAGASGGAHEAVAHEETGVVISDPNDVSALTAELGALLDDDKLRRSYGDQARRRAVAEFDYDVLAKRLDDALQSFSGAH